MTIEKIKEEINKHDVRVLDGLRKDIKLLVIGNEEAERLIDDYFNNLINSLLDGV